MAEGGDFVCDDQMVFGVDGGLHVVTDHTCASTACRHGSSIRVRQRDLPIRRYLHLGTDLLELPHILLEANNLPGFTESSLFPKAAKVAGYSFVELCAKLAQMALSRKK